MDWLRQNREKDLKAYILIKEKKKIALKLPQNSTHFLIQLQQR